MSTCRFSHTERDYLAHVHRGNVPALLPHRGQQCGCGRTGEQPSNLLHCVKVSARGGERALSQRGVVPASGGGQGGDGQGCPALEGGAEAGKPDNPCRGRDGIAFPFHAPFRRATHETVAGTRRVRGGSEEEAIRTAPGGDEKSDPVR